MKLYIAGSSEEIERAEAWIARARAAGFGITTDWPAIMRARPEASATEADLDDAADRDLAGVADADYVWLLVPSAAQPSQGCWYEAGYADGRGVALIASYPPVQPQFCLFTRRAGEEFGADGDAFGWLLMRLDEERDGDEEDVDDAPPEGSSPLPEEDAIEGEIEGGAAARSYEIRILDQAFDLGYGGWQFHFEAIGAPKLADSSKSLPNPILEAYIPLTEANKLLGAGGGSQLATTNEPLHRVAGGFLETIERPYEQPTMPNDAVIVAACRTSLRRHLDAVAKERARLAETAKGEGFVGRTFVVPV